LDVQVHCQGGKGRSGTFCASLMLWSGFGANAGEVLELFAQRRTDRRIDSRRIQGVASPSQIRYVNYIESIVVKGCDFVSPVRILLTSIKLHTMPLYRRNNIRVCFIVECFGTIQYDYGKRHGLAVLSRNPNVQPESDEFKFDLEDVVVAGDVTIRFFLFEDYSLGPSPHGELGPGARTIKYANITGKELCFVTFHTSFNNEDMSFARSEIDAVYDKSKQDFLEGFSISVGCQLNSTPSRMRKLEGPPTSLVKPDITYFNDAVILEDEQRNRKGFSSIPYGTAPGPRLLRLFEVFDDIIKTSCKETLCFKRGQVIYDPEEEELERSLYMIVSGTAEYDFLDEEDQNHMSRINRGDSIAGQPLAAGHLYGELKFLLGNEGDLSSFCIRASSETVLVCTHANIFFNIKSDFMVEVSHCCD
jgi:hypothetical protein